MGFRSSFATFFLKTVLRILCRIDASELKSVPLTGPGIIIINHVNFLEVPLIQAYVYPRRMRGIVKKETWKNPFLRFFLNTYEAIPVDRGGVNKDAFSLIKDTLQSGDFVCIAPEGTRSGTGILQKGKTGISLISSLGDAPIFPVVHLGGENFWNNIKRLRRTAITIKAGKLFRLKIHKNQSREIRERITTETMLQLAKLLPSQKRGIYSKVQDESTNFVYFLQSED